VGVVGDAGAEKKATFAGYWETSLQARMILGSYVSRDHQ